MKDTLTFEIIKNIAASRTYNGMRGHLVTINSQSEMNFLISATNVDSVKIGAYQDRTASDYSEPNGGWRWVTGEPWGYTNWRGGESNNVGGGEDYIELYTDGGWNDVYPLDHAAYMVEYEP